MDSNDVVSDENRKSVEIGAGGNVLSMSTMSAQDTYGYLFFMDIYFMDIYFILIQISYWHFLSCFNYHKCSAMPWGQNLPPEIELEIDQVGIGNEHLLLKFT